MLFKKNKVHGFFEICYLFLVHRNLAKDFDYFSVPISDFENNTQRHMKTQYTVFFHKRTANYHCLLKQLSSTSETSDGLFIYFYIYKKIRQVLL